MKRQSFQHGTLVKRPDAKGFTWILRYSRKNADGTTSRPAIVLGDNKSLPTETAARRKAAEMAPTINDEIVACTFGQLAAKYRTEALPEREHVASAYKSNLKHLEKRWATVTLTAMLKDLVVIEDWISNLKTARRKDGPLEPLSKKSKQHIKALLHRMINMAMKWGYLPISENPIGLVEITCVGPQPKKRRKVPLAPKQYHTLVEDGELPQMVRVMIMLAYTLGMRVSEILALRWEDIDFHELTLNVERSSVGKRVYATKTEASNAGMPMHAYVAGVLMTWKEQCSGPDGALLTSWCFESPITGRPYHRDSLQKDYLVEAGKRHKIENLGWHSFRHSNRATMRSLGIEGETQMLMMRHSDLSTTMSYGVDGDNMDVKRPAHDKVVEAILAARMVTA